MKYVGIDLHKKTIVLCVVAKDRTVVHRKKFLCGDVASIEAWFKNIGQFEFVIEATSSYEWLVKILEPLASDWVLANPSKFRVIADSTNKSDRSDAQNLAEFLALGMIPKAYAPTIRQREHRQLVRYRTECRQRVSRIKCQIRHLAASYNADHRQLFQADKLAELQARKDLSKTDRFLLKERLSAYDQALERVKRAKEELRKFAKQGNQAEQEQRKILRSAPGVGEVVSEIVIAELGDVKRFGSLKSATAYAGLVPGKRQSDEKSRDLGITKKGSRLLRWAMVQAAWSAVQSSPRWRGVYEGIKKRRQSKRAIIAVARRLLAVLVSMLRSGQSYRASLEELRARKATSKKGDVETAPKREPKRERKVGKAKKEKVPV
jgi:transposase